MQRPSCFVSLLILFAFAAAQADPAQTGEVKPLIVGYFGQWGLYSQPQYTLKDLANENRAGMLDQLNYAQAFVTGGRCSIADPNADLHYLFNASDSVDGRADDPEVPFRGHLHQLVKLKRAFPRLKVLISLEGQASDFSFDAQPEHRQAFVASCVNLFIKGDLAPGISVPGLFDGIDVDWEYPHGPDAANFLALLGDLRREMNRVRPGSKLSIAAGPSPRMYIGTDFRAVSALVDEVGLMTYDMAGSWMQTTGFIAPLYRVTAPAMPQDVGVEPGLAVAANGPLSPVNNKPASQAAAPAGSTPVPGPSSRGGVAGSVQAFVAAGVPASKLLVGIPFYGYGWTHVPEAAEGVFQEGTPVSGDRPYSYIATLGSGSTLYRDLVSGTPWLFDGDAFWTFDDPVSIRAKAGYVVDQHLGGLMIWELSGDTPQATLLKAARQALTRSPADHGL